MDAGFRNVLKTVLDDIMLGSEMRMIRSTTVCTLMLLTLTGCASLNRPVCELMEHPKRVVKYPSRVGNVCGSIVGVPVSVVLLPVSYPVTIASGDTGEEGWGVYAPAVFCGDVGTILFGGVPWLGFGWWGNEQEPKGQPLGRPE
ncbi:hypothetical protein ACFLQR_02320 [Verrucomicrobiota bacterium]